MGRQLGIRLLVRCRCSWFCKGCAENAIQPVSDMTGLLARDTGVGQLRGPVANVAHGGADQRGQVPAGALTALKLEALNDALLCLEVDAFLVVLLALVLRTKAPPPPKKEAFLGPPYLERDLGAQPRILLCRMRAKRKPRRLAIEPVARAHLLATSADAVHGHGVIVVDDGAHVGGPVHGLKLAHDGVLKRGDVEVEVADGAAHAVDAAGLDEGLGRRAQEAGDGAEVGAAQEAGAVVQRP